MSNQIQTLATQKSPAVELMLQGARDTMPLVLAALPFGIIFGTLASLNGLSFGATLAMSVFVFAGSAQFIALGLLGGGAAWPLIVLTTFVVNLRHLLYAATLVPYVKHLPQWFRMPLAFLLTDESFAIAMRRFTDEPELSHKHWYYAGSALMMYVNWLFCTLLGLTVGQAFPAIASWGLDFAMPVTFIGLVVPYLVNRPMIAVVLVAGATALLGHALPHKLGLMLATIAGIATGLSLELQAERKKHH